MEKYLSVFKISWEQGLVYRLNFILWRVRTVLQLLLVYFIWWTVFQNQKTLFGYSQAQILTYILISSIIRAIVLSSRTSEISNQINEGSIVNFLIKPLGFIKYFLSREFADKLLNISFVIFEVALLIFLLKPEVIFQSNINVLIIFFLVSILAIVLNFCIGFILSLTSFWVENSWGPQFLLMIFLEGFGGGLFPIDILPKDIFNILMLTPFPYLIYFPSKAYLGTLSGDEMLVGVGILTFWVVLLWMTMQFLLNKGLKHYTAQGN